MTSDTPTPAELDGYLAVARDHRDHERYHSVLKLEEATAWRRDSNALKLLADRWSSDPTTIDRGDPAHGAVGCADLNEPSVIATTGILFLEGASEPAELTAMKTRFDSAAQRYQQLSHWLSGHMSEEWPRLRALLSPQLIATARPRFMTLTRTTSAAHAYALVARLLTTALHALHAQDLSPSGVRHSPTTAAAMVQTAAWLIDTAAATLAESAAHLGLSDPDWTEFISTATAVSED
jgi:hypothetical protein